MRQKGTEKSKTFIKLFGGMLLTLGTQVLFEERKLYCININKKKQPSLQAVVFFLLL